MVGATGTGGMAAQRGGELPVVPEFVQRLGGHWEVLSEPLLVGPLVWATDRTSRPPP